MRGIPHSNSAKNQAIKMRKSGYSFALISEKTKISQSSLSNLLKNIPYLPNNLVKIRINNAAYKAGLISQKRKKEREEKIHQNVSSTIKKLSKDQLFMLGLGIYLGEGSKKYSQVRITNSDPEILLISLRWLQACFHVPNKNIRIELHLYPDVDQQKAVYFWSNYLNISKNQFLKHQFDLRKKINNGKNKQVLLYGTAQLQVKADGSREFGSYLHQLILMQIKRVTELAGVV